MIRRECIFLLALFSVWGWAAGVPADDETETSAWSGRVGIAQKYDSNLDQVSDETGTDAGPGEKPKDGMITEIFTSVRWTSPWDSPWSGSVDLYAISDVFVENLSDTWTIGRANIEGRYRFGANAIYLRNQTMGYTEPDDTEFDNLRSETALTFERDLGAAWHAWTGYENLVHRYFNMDVFNYQGHGGFVELRKGWSRTFTTYLRYDFWQLGDAGEKKGQGEGGAPERVNRHVGEIGTESYLGKRHALGASYSYQVDDASGDGAYQIGEIQGEDENLEIDAEFNVAKHRATLLYSVRIGERFTAAWYNEALHKIYLGNDARYYGGDERTDVSFLSSAWVSMRIVGSLYGRVRYLYRMNDSTIDYLDFQDHVVLGGVEYRF